jgi:hypothetical protein
MFLAVEWSLWHSDRAYLSWSSCDCCQKQMSTKSPSNLVKPTPTSSYPLELIFLEWSKRD